MMIRHTRKTKVKRKPAVRKGSPNRERRGVKFRTLMVRTWWVLRGVAAGILMLGLFYGVYLGSGKVAALPALAVRTIQVEGCRSLDVQTVVRLSGVHEGQPLLRVDLGAVRERVARHPVVKDAAVVRELPDTLRITIRERTPMAAAMDDGFAVFDREGVVLYRASRYTDEFPLISGITSVPEEGKVIIEALPALEAMEELGGTGFLGTDSISEVNMGDERLLVSLTGSGTLLVLPRGDVRNALLKLTRFMEAGLFDTRAPGYDLRFQGRVVVMPERDVTG